MQREKLPNYLLLTALVCSNKMAFIAWMIFLWAFLAAADSLVQGTTSQKAHQVKKISPK